MTAAINFGIGDTALIVEAARQAKVSIYDLSYMLATTYHETAATMRPIREYGSDAYLRSKKYWPHVGRGYVQLTWAYNYIKAGDALGIDFLHNPDLLMQSKYAAPIMIRGMTEGWFTGKKLSDYQTADGKLDYFNARAIINGDKNMYSPADKGKPGAVTIGNKIANYARIYEALLRAANYGVEATPQPVPQPAPVQPTPVPVPTPVAPTAKPAYTSVWSWLKSLFN